MTAAEDQARAELESAMKTLCDAIDNNGPEIAGEIDNEALWAGYNAVESAIEQIVAAFAAEAERAALTEDNKRLREALLNCCDAFVHWQARYPLPKGDSAADKVKAVMNAAYELLTPAADGAEEI